MRWTFQSDVEGSGGWFNYYRTSCGGDTDAAVTKVMGDALLVSDYTLDFTLFTLKDFAKVSEYGYLELDTRAPAPNEEIYIPQHGGWEGRTQFGIEDDMNSDGTCRIDEAASTT